MKRVSGSAHSVPILVSIAVVMAAGCRTPLPVAGTDGVSPAVAAPSGPLEEDLLLDEIDTRLELPESYGQSITISADDQSPWIPPGAMEELVSRRVSMHIEEARVKDLLVALSGIDGINIIADKALTIPPPGANAEPPTLTIHADNLHLRDILRYIARNMGIAFHVTDNVIWVTAAPPTAPGGHGITMETRVYPLRTGLIPTSQTAQTAPGSVGETSALPDGELHEALDAFLAEGPPGALFRIFPDRNLLVIRNTRENLRLVESLLKSFDREPRQVLIEARFISISRSDLEKLGITINQVVLAQSGGKVGFGDLAQSPTIDSTVEKVGAKVTEYVQKSESNMPDALSLRRLEASGSFPGTLTLSGVLGNTTYVAVLDALQQMGSSRILSAPRITVANNRSARIHRGTKRYYFEEYDISTVDEGDQGTATKLVPVGKPREIDLGYSLDVTVNIGNDGRTIMLALRPQINDISGWELFDTAKLPILDENTLDTTVVVNSGETVVLGGMMTKTESAQHKRVPVLSAIPILGRLFTHRSREDQPFHLLIFVNASVIDKDGRFVNVE